MRTWNAKFFLLLSVELKLFPVSRIGECRFLSSVFYEQIKACSFYLASHQKRNRKDRKTTRSKEDSLVRENGISSSTSCPLSFLARSLDFSCSPCCCCCACCCCTGSGIDFLPKFHLLAVAATPLASRRSLLSVASRGSRDDNLPALVGQSFLIHIWPYVCLLTFIALLLIALWTIRFTFWFPCVASSCSCLVLDHKLPCEIGKEKPDQNMDGISMTASIQVSIAWTTKPVTRRERGVQKIVKEKLE